MRRTVIVPLNLRMPAGGAMSATVVDTVWDFIIVRPPSTDELRRLGVAKGACRVNHPRKTFTVPEP
jgi:hypothetical protein